MSEAGSGGDVESPDPLLPEESVLTLEEYLAMQRAIGNETRYRVLRTLTHNGALSATELQDALDVASNTLHYHLDTLVDVGLVQNRKRADPDSEGLYSYYRASALGEAILEHGVEELMRREHEFLDAYHA
jgi:DNA-binding transcriptional ArsR family regulator